tara:strand:+ start:73 stop:414 length:342 start_codon:yes stop_codon:yes gene_type:complete
MISCVRNLSRSATETDVRRAFETIGPVASVILLSHEATRRPLGVALVDMPNTHEHQTLNCALVGVQIDGTEFRVGPPRAGRDRRDGRDRRVNSRAAPDRRTNDRRVVDIADYR